MNADLPRLRELQLVDDRIRELTEEISRLPKYVAEIERQLETHKKNLAADQEALAENKKSHRLLEGEISSLEQKASRLREQMNEAKTNDQFRAFQHEIEFMEAEIRKAEDRILDKMVEAETIGQNIKNAEAALKAESQKVEQEVSEVRARVAKDEQEAVVLREKRREIAEALSSGVLRLYEQVRKTRGGVAVARAEADRCLACNVKLRPQFSQILRQQTEVLTCESCGRILYYEPPESLDIGSSAGESNVASR